MDDVWFGPDLGRGDLATLLRALSLDAGRLPPLLAVAEGGTRLALASRALFRFFDAASAEDLAGRLLSGGDPGARRLADLGRTLAIDGAPRLERLRYSVSPASEVVTVLCRRILFRDGQPLLVAAALGMGATPLDGTAWDVSAAVDVRAEPPPGPPLVTWDAPPPVAPAAPTPVAPADPPPPDPPRPPLPAGTPSVQAIQAMLHARWPAKGTVRFLWQTDAGGVLTALSPQLAQVVGAANAELVGRDLAALATRLDPGGRLREALAARKTWSGLDVAWPVAEADVAVETRLGAIAAFDRDGGFEGYRGYGVLHLDRVVPHERVRLAEVAPPTTAKVVSFPGGAKPLSPEDNDAFRLIGDELRRVDVPAPGERATAPSPPAGAAGPRGIAAGDVLAVLDRLAVALLVSRDAVPIYANRPFLELTGFADEDALHAAGGLAHLFGDAPVGAGAARAVGVRARNGAVIPVVARMQRTDWDGLPATLLTLAVPAPTAAGGGEEAGADADELRDLRAITETAADGVAVVDAAGILRSLNRSGEALLGCDRGAVTGTAFLDLFAADNRAPVAEYFAGLLSDPTKRLLNDGREILVQVRGNGTIPVFMTLGRLGADEAGAPRFYALFRDLSPLKKVERDLRAAREDAQAAGARKSDFVGRVSQEIRAPLNAVVSLADLVLGERSPPGGDDRHRGYLLDIRAAGRHVLTLLGDLADLTRIEAGDVPLAPEAIDLSRVVGEAVAELQPRANRERIIMRLSLAPHLPRISADGRTLRQCLDNILLNAVRFNEPGGQVIVASTRTEDGHVVIRVRDTGPGMTEGELAAALAPFGPADHAAPDAAAPGLGAAGLSLPLSRALAEANQAAFSIRSNRDQGTMVEIAFPPARVLAG